MLNVLFRQYLAPKLLRHFYRIKGAGILTCSSIGYPHTVWLALGSTNPGTILVALETLGLRREGLSPSCVLLVPTFSLPNAPHCLATYASQRFGMLLYQSSFLQEIPQFRYNT